MLKEAIKKMVQTVQTDETLLKDIEHRLMEARAVAAQEWETFCEASAASFQAGTSLDEKARTPYNRAERTVEELKAGCDALRKRISDKIEAAKVEASQKTKAQRKRDLANLQKVAGEWDQILTQLGAKSAEVAGAIQTVSASGDFSLHHQLKSALLVIPHLLDFATMSLTRRKSFFMTAANWSTDKARTRLSYYLPTVEKE